MSFYPEVEKDSVLTLVVPMVDETDNESEETGLTLVIEGVKSDETSKNTITPTSVTHIGDGDYRIVFADTLTDTEGVVLLRISATGANWWKTAFNVVDMSTRTAIPATLDSTGRNAIADHVLRRQFVNAVNSSDGDTSDINGEFTRTLMGGAATAGAAQFLFDSEEGVNGTFFFLIDNGGGTTQIARMTVGSVATDIKAMLSGGTIS